MDLNTIGIYLLCLIFLYLGYRSWISTSAEIYHRIPNFLVAQDTGKFHHNQSKTGDASMNTELRRRRAIQHAGRTNKFNPSLGTKSGAIETYFITGICVCIPCSVKKILYDGGSATSEFCPIHDGATYDAGNSTTKVCEECVVTKILYDGGSATGEFCPIHDGATYDAGNSTTKVCEECVVTKILYDGGSATGEFCPIHDGATYDAGNSTTKICETCVVNNTSFAGGSATSEFCPIHDGATYDAGNSKTIVSCN